MNRDGQGMLGPGLATLAIGAGVTAVTLLSLGQDDPDFARTQWSARLAMALAAPALVLYPVSTSARGKWRTSFWTAALGAYLLHFWWAVAVTYHVDFQAIAARQGWVAYANYAVTAIWSADVALGFAPSGGRLVGRLFRPLAWAAVAASFIGATAVFRDGAAAAAGWALLLVLVVSLGARACGYRLSPVQEVSSAGAPSPAAALL